MTRTVERMGTKFREPPNRLTAMLLAALALGAARTLPPSTASGTAGSPPVPQRSEPVARCTATDTVLIDEFHGDSMDIVETRLTGERIRTIYHESESYYVAVDRARQRALGRTGYVDLATGQERAVPRARYYLWPSFIDGQHRVVSQLDSARSRATPPWKGEIEILDLDADTVVARFAGYNPKAAPDGTLMFLLAAGKPVASSDSTSDDAPPPYIDIMRWDARGAERLKRVELSDEGGPYGITEVAPLSRERFLYRVYDEHEYRYYDPNGLPFFPGKGARVKEDGTFQGGKPKEQYALTSSDDGRYISFTERNWNELTYLVVVDVATWRRIQTPYYGSFPRIYGDYVLFVSDPSFVLGGNTDFRRIAHYAVYAYHIPTASLCEVARYPDGVGVQEP